MSVWMNELFSNSEFISFGVQTLVKACINGTQYFFSFVPQLKQYVTCIQPDPALRQTRMSPTAVNENSMRISEG